MDRFKSSSIVLQKMQNFRIFFSTSIKLIGIYSHLIYSYSLSPYTARKISSPSLKPYFICKQRQISRASVTRFLDTSSAQLSLVSWDEGDANISSEVISVNFFFSRKCNCSCKFCFHTAKNDYTLPLEKVYEGIKLLKEAGCEKINFAGGEPFLHPFELGMMVQQCNKLGIEVSIISNASCISPPWMKNFGKYVDVLGVSLDSFDPVTNGFIGRGADVDNKHLSRVLNVRDLCEKYNIKFKVNTVVSTLNWKEDMNTNINLLNPMRWKVFQVLLLHGENSGANGDLRDVRNLLITNDMFQSFVDRHSAACPQLVPEPNNLMKDSYIMLDEKMRFLNCQCGSKTPTDSILEVGVNNALKQAGFNKKAFLKRGGIFDWNKTKGL
jgi:radical S-adenosyl methionine domain-containing protein 2